MLLLRSEFVKGQSFLTDDYKAELKRRRLRLKQTRVHFQKICKQIFYCEIQKLINKEQAAIKRLAPKKRKAGVMIFIS